MSVLADPPNAEALIPLTRYEANLKAVHLRRLGMTYGAIALAMAHYHGYWFKAEQWRNTCRRSGAVPVRRSSQQFAGRCSECGENIVIADLPSGVCRSCREGS